MDDMDTKDFFAVHLILGVCDYTKIKTETAPLIGAANEPIAEKTKFGCIYIYIYVIHRLGGPYREKLCPKS